MEDTDSFKIRHPAVWWIQANWKAILGTVVAALGTAAGYAIGVGMSRQERQDDQESRARLERNLKGVSDTVSELEKHTAKIEEHLVYEDQRMNRMEGNWDDAREIAGMPPRKRGR